MNKLDGFDLDESTVETFDAILIAIANDPELGEEFSKLSFIQTLKGDYDGSDGPIKQIMQKLAQLERAFNNMLSEHAKAQMDSRRAVNDMVSAIEKMQKVAATEDREERLKLIEELNGIKQRQSSYTWNQQ